MKLVQKLVVSTAAVLMLLSGLSSNVFAGHYNPGTNGGAEGWVPHPGFNFRFDVINITRDDLYDEHENHNPHVKNFDLDVLATVPSFTYSTSEPVLLGARYGARLVIPVVDKHLQMTTPGGNISDPDSHALGDIDVQPIMLGWGGPKTCYDSMIGLGFVLPTGEYDGDKADKTKVYCGDGYYTTYLQGGVNYFFDQARSWYVSGLFHLLFNGEQDDTEAEIAEELIFEYGVGKEMKICDYMLRAGLAGYAYWQLDEDDNPPAMQQDPAKSKYYGLGPELELVIPAAKCSFEARYYQEFGASDAPEGQQVVFTFVKAF